MPKTMWVGEALRELLNPEVTDEQLAKKYNKTKNNIRTIRKYYKRKAMNPENTPENVTRRLVSESEYDAWIKNSDGEIESEPKVARRYEYVYDGEDFDPEAYRATPARITPSRAKPVQKDHKDIFVFGDPQIGYRRINEETLLPIHDERKMRTARRIARAIRPELIVNLSDTIDLAEFGTYPKDSNHFERVFQASLNAVHQMYAEYRSDHPDSRIVEVPSNHNERLNKYILQYCPQLYGVQRAATDSKYPMASYPYMANLEHVNVEWIGGYPAGEFVYGEEYDTPPIVFRHGTQTDTKSTTAAAKARSDYPETHNVQGHAHRDSEAWHTRRDGTQLGTFVLGALCKLTGEVPSYWSAVGQMGEVVKRQENWTSSVMHIRDFGNGKYEFNRIMIHPDGTAYYGGKEFDGRE